MEVNHRWLWLAAGLALATSQAIAGASDNTAEAAYASGRFVDAARLWTVRAEAGDPRAEFGLGILYDLGQGVPRDPRAAYQWYSRAALAGLPDAAFNAAALCDTGDGVPRDASLAASWYARAAAHGNRRAQYNLGQLYASGDGVPKNMDQAETWFRTASVDLPAAATRLAEMKRTARPRPSPSADARFESVVPVAPADGSVAAVVKAGQPAIVEMAWTAPAEPAPVRFFLQILSIDADGAGSSSKEVFAAYLDESATLAPVGAAPGHYAWRVYSVALDLHRYVASDWVRFEVAVRD